MPDDMAIGWFRTLLCNEPNAISWMETADFMDRGRPTWAALKRRWNRDWGLTEAQSCGR